MNDDRWECCATCRFWESFFKDGRNDSLLKRVEPHGRCQRYPPVAVGQEPHDPPDDPTQFWLQPATLPCDWCGEWQDKAPPAKPEPAPYPSWQEFTRGGRGISRRVRWLLWRSEGGHPSITSVETLVTQSEINLLRRPGFGPVALGEVVDRLANFGLRLRGDEFSPARS